MTKEDIYENFKQWLQSLIPGNEWKSAVLNIEVQPGVLGMNGTAILSNDSTTSLRTRPTEEIKQAIWVLHDITTQNGVNKWNKLKFSLFPDGRYEAAPFWDEIWQNEVDRMNRDAKKNNPGYEGPKWKWES
jgi:hypothetical protein